MNSGTARTISSGTAAAAGAMTGAAISPQRPPVSRWIMISVRLPTRICAQNAKPTSQPAAAALASNTAAMMSSAADPCSADKRGVPPIAVRWMVRAGSSDAAPLASGISGDGGAARQLQRADIGGDRPAVVRIDAVGIGKHHAIAVGDDVVEMLRRRRGEPVDVIGRRRRKAVRDDDAVAIAGEAVAGRAVDVEALAAAREQLGGDGRRRFGRGGAFDVALRDHVGRQRPRRRCRRATATVGA